MGSKPVPVLSRAQREYLMDKLHELDKRANAIAKVFISSYNIPPRRLILIS